MSAEEKLQKAMETTLAAGYQLDSEAFEFLSQNSDLNDPVDIMNSALRKLQDLEEKPFFIDKAFLETLAQQLTVPVIETQTQPQQQHPIQQHTTQHLNQVIADLNTSFYPYAKDIKSNLFVLEDATGKLSSNGTLEEYILYFQDRFKRIEHLLRQRIDVRAATSIIEALKSPAKTKLKLICMITEKRESKNQMILSVEDLQGSATVLVPQKAQEEVKKRALLLLPDQVVCLAVIKTRTNLFLARRHYLSRNRQKTSTESPRTSLCCLNFGPSHWQQ